MSFFLLLEEPIPPFFVVSQLYSQMPFGFVYIDDTTVIVNINFKYAGESHVSFFHIMTEGLIINEKRYEVTPCFPWNKWDTAFLEKSKTSSITEIHPVTMVNMYTSQNNWFIPSPPRYLW